MEKLSLSKTVCVFVFCVATAIVSLAQILTTLHSFDNTDGAYPFAGLVQATDGNFYGTTYNGGANNEGAVFKITPSGTLVWVYSFCSQPNCTDGALPVGGLIQYSDGNLYGTAGYGGANNRGTVFKITLSGTLTTLYNFCNLEACADGSQPYAGLLLATDGNFYGTTLFGGKYTYGSIFEITSGGLLTTLYSFCPDKNPCPDGARPSASLIQAANGGFYGTTQAGGANHNNDCATEGCGTVFEFTGGALTTLYSFCAQSGCTDGQNPVAGLIQASNGNFYGTTEFGGANNNNGTVFKITASGMLTTLYSFCSKSACTDGQGPQAGLLQATDGNLYGTTTAGGSKGAGTIFEMTPSGTLATVYYFCYQSGCSDGEGPYAALIQGTDGKFYGTTFGGGAHGYGAVFSLSGTAQFVPVTPCRLVDTRTQYGGGGPIPGQTSQTFNLPSLAELGKFCPAFSVASAAVYSLNVTVVPPGPLGYLTIWAAGQPQPTVSTLSSADGRVKADAAIVAAGANGSVSVFVSDTTNVVLDIDAYFAPATQSTLAFYPLPPCRVADTRKNNFPQGLGAPHLSANVPRDFPVLSSTCNIPNTASAYSLNFTAVPYPSLGDPLGYLEVWPTGKQPQHPVSTLNNPTGTVVANAAIVPAGTGSEVTAFASNDTDLVIDINGYFALGPGGLSLYPVAPCRVLDTRKTSGAFIHELTVNVAGSTCAPPTTAQAYVFNATVVPSGSLGYLTLWADGQQQPGVSTLSALDGAISSNMAIVQTTNGKIDAYASDLTQLVLDISSYFAP